VSTDARGRRLGFDGELFRLEDGNELAYETVRRSVQMIVRQMVEFG